VNHVGASIWQFGFTTLVENCYGFLNPNQTTTLLLTTPKLPATKLSGLVILSQEIPDNLFKVELFLFCRFHMEKADGLNMLNTDMAMKQNSQMWGSLPDRFWAS
jgi:hypothetical protein